MLLFLRLPFGGTQVLNLREDETVGGLCLGSLQSRIEDAHGSPASQQRLMCRGKYLEGGGLDRTLSEFGVVLSESLVLVSTRSSGLRGGKGGFGAQLRQLGKQTSKN